MKKTFLFLAGSAIMFASCGNGEQKKDDAAQTQAQIDSAVAAKTDSANKAMEAENQAKIQAEAQRKADSMKMEEEKAAASKGSSKGGGTKSSGSGTTKPTAPPPPPPPPPPPATPKPNPRPGAH